MSAQVVAVTRLAPAMVAVCEVFRCTPKDIISRRRFAPLVQPRQVLMWLAVRRYGLSLPVTAAALGGKHHTTVLHARRAIEAQLEHDVALREVIDRVERRLTALEAS